MYYGDKVVKTLQQCTNKRHIPGLESFRAKITNGFVLVECRECEVFMESFTLNSEGVETRTGWVGALDAAARRLEEYEIDLSSVEMLKRTLGSCVLINKSAPELTRYNESCEGFGKSGSHDEPCEFCQNCNLFFLDSN